MMEFLHQVEQTGFSTWVRESPSVRSEILSRAVNRFTSCFQVLTGRLETLKSRIDFEFRPETQLHRHPAVSDLKLTHKLYLCPNHDDSLLPDLRFKKPKPPPAKKRCIDVSPAAVAEGPTPDWLCAGCGFSLSNGIPQLTFIHLVLKCAKCGALNDTKTN
jgi:hypothetical protein